jgi:hypothetical protein
MGVITINEEDKARNNRLSKKIRVIEKKADTQ